jgi:hypothetical protein
MLTLSDVKELLHQGEGQDILSLYLHVDNAVRENQAANPAWRISLKKNLRSLDDEVTEEGRAIWEAIREQAEEFFQHYAPSGKGVVAFFGPDWEQVHPLPVPVENAAAYGRPLVGPLLRALDEYQAYLVLMVDQEEAHFYESYLGQAEFRDSIEIDLDEYDFGEKSGMPPTSAKLAASGTMQTNNREAFEDMIDAHRMRFYRDVAEHLRLLAEQDDIDRIILGGDEQAANTVRKQLPDALRHKVVDVVSIPRHFSTHEVFEHVQPLAVEYERDEEIRAVDEVINAARAGGRAVLGPEAVATALDRQQVAALILAWPPEQTDGANDLAYRALSLNSAIEIVHDAAADKLRKEASGVAARLYYTM